MTTRKRKHTKEAYAEPVYYRLNINMAFKSVEASYKLMTLIHQSESPSDYWLAQFRRRPVDSALFIDAEKALKEHSRHTGRMDNLVIFATEETEDVGALKLLARFFMFLPGANQFRPSMYATIDANLSARWEGATSYIYLPQQDDYVEFFQKFQVSNGNGDSGKILVSNDKVMLGDDEYQRIFA